MVTAGYALLYVGLLYLIMRFLFPHALLMPVMVTAAVVYAALCFARIRVAFDRAAGEVAITTGFWTRHAPVTQLERVQVGRFGAKIRIGDTDTYEFGPCWRSRWLARWAKVRSGFEGMDRVLPQAAADARAADPVRAAAEDADSRRALSRRSIPGACFAGAAGLIALTAAALVQPQAGGWLVHALALLLRIYFAVAGIVAVLLGSWLLRNAWRDRHAARQA
jgi:hypothetical protein